MSNKQMKMQVLSYQIYFQPVFGGLKSSLVRILYTNWENLTSARLCTLPPSPITSTVKQGYLCLKSNRVYINKQRGLVGTVENLRQMPCLKKAAIYSAPAAYCLA